MNFRKLWLSFAAVVVLSFAVLDGRDSASINQPRPLPNES
jgi:hypothetical protein